uniref:Uncharacterized protein n=1 Tax=Arundo donax TaxID=35708 RepID=A0A0A9HQ11_ARUDO
MCPSRQRYERCVLFLETTIEFFRISFVTFPMLTWLFQPRWRSKLPLKWRILAMKMMMTTKEGCRPLLRLLLPAVGAKAYSVPFRKG